MKDAFRETAQDLLDYIAASPTPFHAVHETAARLQAAGFRRLEEEERWEPEPGGRYYTIRNGSSLAAFVAGRRPMAEAGCRIVGAHTDSPNLRLKPTPTLTRQGYRQLGVVVYGGAIVASWADRDLGLAGRVFVEDGDRAVPRLVKIDRPVARVPLVAIHLDREVNDKGLLLNKETQLPPVLGLSFGGSPIRPASRGSASASTSGVSASAVSPASPASPASSASPASAASRASAASDADEPWSFEGWMARELGVAPEAVIDHELMFYDLAPPTFGGIDEEFLFAPRLDNLASCHAGLTALVESATTEADATRLVVLYDNEEVGSSTRQGASGPFLEDLLFRLHTGESEGIARARARTVLVSADMAHAVHPNYADKHEGRHMPRCNGGPVIKYNANQRYATDAETGALFQTICREADVPFQKFAMRSDLPCGSTIGPLVATRLGIRTVDVGNPMLSMHSVREMGGAMDPLLMVRALKGFYLS